jgi:DNA-binding MarR family transcriptional regulator
MRVEPEPRTAGSTAALAEVALLILRACAAIADESLEQVAPSVTLQQFRALTVLHEHGPLNAASLADALGIARSTLTRLANRLVRDRLVERVSDPSDRRVVVLTVSRQGSRIAERVKEARLRELERRLGVAAAGDAAVLHEGLVLAARLLAPEEV